MEGLGNVGQAFQNRSGLIIDDDSDHFVDFVAHLIGHNLGLLHVDTPADNLMARPIIGTTLTIEQGNTARASSLIE
jgi:hypothetical protein